MERKFKLYKENSNNNNKIRIRWDRDCKIDIKNILVDIFNDDNEGWYDIYLDLYKPLDQIFQFAVVIQLSKIGINDFKELNIILKDIPKEDLEKFKCDFDST